MTVIVIVFVTKIQDFICKFTWLFPLVCCLVPLNGPGNWIILDLLLPIKYSVYQNRSCIRIFQSDSLPIILSLLSSSGNDLIWLEICLCNICVLLLVSRSSIHKCWSISVFPQVFMTEAGSPISFRIEFSWKSKSVTESNSWEFQTWIWNQFVTRKRNSLTSLCLVS